MNWYTIPGLPMYEASDTGLIRSKSRPVNIRHGDRQYRKVIPGKVLKLTPTVWRGHPHYMSVPIHEKTYLVHRLVALAWLANTWFEGAEVNHRTRIRDDHQLQAELAYDEIDSSRRFPVTFDEMTEKSVTLTYDRKGSFRTR